MPDSILGVLSAGDSNQQDLAFSRELEKNQPNRSLPLPIPLLQEDKKC